MYKEIFELAGQYEAYTSRNLSKLVQIKSVSCHERDVQEEVMRQMHEAGIEEVTLDGLGNVIGKIGKGDCMVAFDGHIDTVDTGNLRNWQSDPFSGEIKDGFVHGRGTVDQKGGVASFITAARIIKDLRLHDKLTVYFTSSVIEEDCDGLCWKYILEQDNIRPDLVVLTEPTNLNIYIGHRGRMEARVEFTGISAHGSAPERGKNAVYMASKAALEIEKLNEVLATDEFLGKGSVTISEIVSGSPSLCAVADYARIHLDRRLTWGETEDSALKEFHEAVKAHEGQVHVLDYEETAFTGLRYGMKKYYPTWKMERNDPWILKAEEAFRNVFKKNPLTDKWTFSTNGVVIRGMYGIPCLGFGPGNEIYAHAPNEKVPVSDLVNASAFYASLAFRINQSR